MKVLIAGGYSYAGVKIAEKFINEKHIVNVIGKPSDDKKSPIVLKYRFFSLDARDDNCRKVFEAGSFDIVIYISPSLYSKDDDFKNADMRGIANIAALSAEAGVKKFIIITHIGIYGSGAEDSSAIFSEDSNVRPDTYRGMADNIMEYYAIKICAAKKIPVLCLRVSEIYGPGASGSESSFYSEVVPGKKDIEQMLPGEMVSFIASYVSEKNKLPVIKDRLPKHDYIFIEDAVTAIYKAAIKKGLSGIFNVTSHTGTAVTEIMEILAVLSNIGQVNYSKKSDYFNIESIKAPNSKLKNAIDWQPCVTIEDGLKKCIEEHKKIKEAKIKNKKAAAQKKKAPDTAPKRSFMAVLAVFENLLLFLIFAFLQWGELFFKINLPDAVMDYSIVYIIIVAIIWGQVQAYLAMFLSSALFIAINILTGTDIITFIYTPENLVRLAVYLLVGIITGYAIERRNREIGAKEMAIDALSQKYSFLLEIYNQTKIVKNELESQIISAEDSFSSIYEAIKKVDSLEIEAVYSGAINAIEKIMKTDSVSIYTTGINVRSGFVRLKARSLSLAGVVPNSVNTSQAGHFKYVIEGKCRYINRDFEPSAPLIMAPVLDGKKVIAVISIHSAEFENLTSHYENLFLTVISLITNAIKKAYYFEESFKDRKYIKGTNVLNTESFEKILSEMKKYKDQLGMGFSVLSVHGSLEPLEEISGSISKIIRENDYIGVNADGDIRIVLSNTENDNASIVIERLKKQGIDANLAGGENEYD